MALFHKSNVSELRIISAVNCGYVEARDPHVLSSAHFVCLNAYDVCYWACNCYIINSRMQVQNSSERIMVKGWMKKGKENSNIACLPRPPMPWSNTRSPFACFLRAIRNTSIHPVQDLVLTRMFRVDDTPQYACQWVHAYVQLICRHCIESVWV